MKKSHIVMISLAVLAVIAWAFHKPFLAWLHELRARRLSTETMEGERIQPGTATFPLQKGKRGTQILYWQAWLNLFAGADIETMDGIWGNETERENNDHYRHNQVPESEYISKVLPNILQIASYLATKGVKNNG